MTERLRLFVACAPGLEDLLTAELVELGIDEVAATAGGACCFGDHDAIHRINLGSGLGLRVLVRVAEFFVRDFAKLERVARALEWERWLLSAGGQARGQARGQAGDRAAERPARIRIRAHAKRSRLYHTKAIVERVERGIVHRLGARVELRADEAEGPGGGELEGGASEPVLIQIRLVRDRCTISVDTTGALLHKRGWRLQTAKAPLREDIARALLSVSGWRPGMALFDPVAGAGTLVIEAATIAAGRLPGLGRSFAGVEHGRFDPARFVELRAELVARARTQVEPWPSMIGCDRDAGAIAAAQANAARAGIVEHVTFAQRSVGDPELPTFDLGPEPGIALVANPPWGRRVGDPGRLRNLYASLGQLARRLPRPTRIGIATSDAAFASATELGLERRLVTDQGGVKIGLWTGQLT